jgi:hypothetical protein
MLRKVSSIGLLTRTLASFLFALFRSLLGGVSGNHMIGCDAIVVAGNQSRLREEDHMQWLLYSANSQQRGGALYTSGTENRPVRVFRSSNLHSPFSAPKPSLMGKGKTAVQYRYDGLYLVTRVWDVNGGHFIDNPASTKFHTSSKPYTFLLERIDSRGHGDDGSPNAPSDPPEILPPIWEEKNGGRFMDDTARTKFYSTSGGLTHPFLVERLANHGDVDVGNLDVLSRLAILLLVWKAIEEFQPPPPKRQRPNDWTGTTTSNACFSWHMVDGIILLARAAEFMDVFS